MNQEISIDIGEQIIKKLKLLNEKLDKLLEGRGDGEEESSDSFVS